MKVQAVISFIQQVISKEAEGCVIYQLARLHKEISGHPLMKELVRNFWSKKQFHPHGLSENSLKGVCEKILVKKGLVAKGE